jgi:deferrochelatase/peroxidase EfeB
MAQAPSAPDAPPPGPAAHSSPEPMSGPTPGPAAHSSPEPMSGPTPGPAAHSSPEPMCSPPPDPAAGRPSRRSLLRGGLLAGAGLGVGAVAGGFAGRAVAGPATTAVAEPFQGVHQAGIVTNSQRQTVLAAFDLTGNERGDLTALLQAWTRLGGELVTGASVTIPIYSPGPGGGDAYADATGGSTTDDSFEAYGLGPNRLTLTVGFGRSLFVTAGGADRFGLSGQLPAALIDLPHFAGDELAAADGSGDLFLQACADDPQVAFHAVRSLGRIAPDVATLRWTQLGFSPDNTAGTPRNLMGFKDGTMTSNVHPPADLDATVWAGPEGPAWMHGGSYLVYRRIRITLEHWDRLPPGQQEQVIGRQKLSGAPLGAASEFSALDLDQRDARGNLVIPVDSHVRLAAPATNGGAVMLRRAFSYQQRYDPVHRALAAVAAGAGVRRGPAVPGLPEGSQAGVRARVRQACQHRRAEPVHHPHGQRHLRHPARPLRPRRLDRQQTALKRSEPPSHAS